MGIVPVIPSLLFIITDKTRCVTMTQKKNLKFGIERGNDIVINHPYFANRTEVLGRDAEASKLQRKTTTSHILPCYTFNIDGLCVRYIHLRTFFLILLLFCIGTVFSIKYLPGHRDRLNAQDWTPIVLPADGIYGFCRQDWTHGEGVNFIFEAEASRSYRLFFFAGSNGVDTTIKLSLNGFETDNSLRLPTGWGNETSFMLPSALINIGENSLVISPENHSNSRIYWGISEVRVHPAGPSSATILQALSHTPEEILYALSDQDLKGEDLASYYKSVETWDTSVISKDVSIPKVRILAEIEQRMKDLLRKVAFKVRSNQVLGDQSGTRQLLDETAGWLPENWVEGWEIYREICR